MKCAKKFKFSIRVTTVDDSIKKQSWNHSHPRDAAGIDAVKAMEKVKERVIDSRDTVQYIVSYAAMEVIHVQGKMLDMLCLIVT